MDRAKAIYNFVFSLDKETMTGQIPRSHTYGSHIRINFKGTILGSLILEHQFTHQEHSSGINLSTLCLVIVPT